MSIYAIFHNYYPQPVKIVQFIPLSIMNLVIIISIMVGCFLYSTMTENKFHTYLNTGSYGVILNNARYQIGCEDFRSSGFLSLVLT